MGTQGWRGWVVGGQWHATRAPGPPKLYASTELRTGAPHGNLCERRGLGAEGNVGVDAHDNRARGEHSRMLV